MRTGDKKRQFGKAVRASASAAVLALLCACVNAPQTNISALDPKNGDGIGGTGIKSAQINTRGDGIGGTGVRGTITGFGSILVNGLKLDFDHKTKVEIDGKPTSLEALRIGQIIQAVARTQDGKLSLAAIEIQHAVSGPISAIDAADETLTILGQKVRLNLAGDKAAAEAFKTLQAGDMVSVSGLRQADGTVIATRVDQMPDDGRIMLRGTASAVTSTSVRVGELDFNLPAGTTVTPIRTGGRVFVSGRMINDRFVADVVSGSEPLGFDKDVAEVSLEAYAPAAAGGAGTLTVDGVSVSGAALPAGTAVNDRIIISGQISGPNAVAATSIGAVRTFVTIHAARGSVRPAAVRPDTARPERVAPRPNIDRPQSVRPDSPAGQRPGIERPQGVPMI